MTSELPISARRSLLSRHQAVTTVICAVVAAGLLAIGVVTGRVEALDRWGLELVRTAGPYGASDAPSWLRETVRDVTALGGAFPLTLAVIASALYLVASGRLRLACLLAGSAACATLVNVMLKASFDRLRPALDIHMVHVSNASFPSGHALLSASIILMLGGLLSVAARRRRQKRVILGTAILLCVAIGLSRVWLGVHWPTDVLAGWLIGAAWAAATLVLAEHMEAMPMPAVGQNGYNNGLGRQGRS